MSRSHCTHCSPAGWQGTIKIARWVTYVWAGLYDKHKLPDALRLSGHIGIESIYLIYINFVGRIRHFCASYQHKLNTALTATDGSIDGITIRPYLLFTINDKSCIACAIPVYFWRQYGWRIKSFNCHLPRDGKLASNRCRAAQRH